MSETLTVNVRFNWRLRAVVVPVWTLWALKKIRLIRDLDPWIDRLARWIVRGATIEVQQ